ncbi:collagen alpha-1(I) chain-like [Mustela erminea]|uniref:collagen alpha-1(I) chain-like n=1 Tax=Mustela erminea TaxID=36723 RepID=UPI0013875E00|nr:collagen alpha-1(I) chain-like [Mustela erminea]
MPVRGEAGRAGLRRPGTGRKAFGLFFYDVPARAGGGSGAGRGGPGAGSSGPGEAEAGGLLPRVVLGERKGRPRRPCRGREGGVRARAPDGRRLRVPSGERRVGPSVGRGAEAPRAECAPRPRRGGTALLASVGRAGLASGGTGSPERLGRGVDPAVGARLGLAPRPSPPRGRAPGLAVPSSPRRSLRPDGAWARPGLVLDTRAPAGALGVRVEPGAPASGLHILGVTAPRAVGVALRCGAGAAHSCRGCARTPGPWPLAVAHVRTQNTGPQWLSWEGLGLEKWGLLITTSLVNLLGTQEPESLEEKVP